MRFKGTKMLIKNQNRDGIMLIMEGVRDIDR